MHDVAEFLKAHEPFSGLDDADVDRLAERAKVESPPARSSSSRATSRVFPTATVAVFKPGTTKARIVYNLTNPTLEDYHLVGAGPTAAEALTIDYSRITPTMVR